MKTIGILGGMGPRSTSPFLELLLDECQIQYGAKYDIDFPHIIVYSLPTPFYIDREINKEELKNSIKSGIKRLETCGVDLIGIPCNSAHEYFDEIVNDIKIPVLNIIKETVKEIDEGAKVTLLATEMTVKSGLYQKGISDKNSIYEFKAEWQKEVNRIITNIKNKKEIDKTRNNWNELLKQIREAGIEVVIVACTDLNVVIGNNNELKIIDSSKYLAKGLIRDYLQIKD